MKLSPKKSLGQNFLIDENVLNLIVKCGQIKKNDFVIEVGPGTGNLTEKILNEKPKKIVVIEKDKKLANFLKIKFNNKIEIINKDILNYSLIDNRKNKLIIFGNLPYNVSTQVLSNLIKTNNIENICKSFVLMFQKEVADRIVAKYNSKNYGRLSILSSWKMEIEKIKEVEPKSFYPKPKVKSTILLFKPKSRFYQINNPKNLEHITNVFFNLRRKMIKKPLKILFRNFNQIADYLDLDLNSRPQNLSHLTYYKICSEYEKLLK
tara:strand:- start:895 stop:1686 length:792 start_codon:yes stop_codon:yes gene_type:complete